MKTFEVVGDIYITTGSVRFTVLIHGVKRVATSYGSGRYPVIAGDALHEALERVWPGLKKVRVPPKSRNEDQAWQAVVDGYEQQVAEILAKPKPKRRR